MNAISPKATVSVARLRLRLKHHLAQQGLRLRKARVDQQKELGKHFLVDNAGRITERNVDVVKLAQEHGCIQAWERLE